MAVTDRLYCFLIMKLSEELTWRGFVNQTTFKDIAELDKKPLSFYWGVDPSAPSMTIGNLAAAMMVRHFIKHGHKAVLLVGGATGMIGDPDGKAEERNLLTFEELAANKKAIAAQYKTVFGGQHFTLVDNYDWFKDLGYLEFLRDVGKHVPMRQMLGRDFIQTRLSEEGAGISYAEFSYALIQGYDFLHLYRKHNVTLQVAASDQWGNSITGVELIRRILGKEAHVWTTPLIVNKATGKKFGKTENGAIWLDPQLTSVYKFYQFWLNADDDGVEDYLKIYTDLEKEDVDSIMKSFEHDKARRLAQKTLAYEVTKLVHGSARADSVKRISEALFGSTGYSALKGEDFELLSQELPVAQIASLSQAKIIDAMLDTGLAGSKTEARRFIQDGAVSINGQTLKDEKDILHLKLFVLKRGKNSMALVKVK